MGDKNVAARPKTAAAGAAFAARCAAAGAETTSCAVSGVSIVAILTIISSIARCSERACKTRRTIIKNYDLAARAA